MRHTRVNFTHAPVEDFIDTILQRVTSTSELTTLSYHPNYVVWGLDQLDPNEKTILTSLLFAARFVKLTKSDQLLLAFLLYTASHRKNVIFLPDPRYS